MSAVRTRVVPTSVDNGYGPGRWLAQYYDASMKVWFDIGDPHDTEAGARAAADAHGKNPQRSTDYIDSDFDEGCSGFYRVWYGRAQTPAGPYWSVADMAKAQNLTEYPDDGYIVWHQEGEGTSNVPSLNPDELLQK